MIAGAELIVTNELSGRGFDLVECDIVVVVFFKLV